MACNHRHGSCCCVISDSSASLLLVLSLLCSVFFITTVHSRSILKPEPSGLISDGIHDIHDDQRNHPTYLFLKGIDKTGVSSGLSEEESAGSSGSSTCEQTYGFMPCTTTWLGNLFLIIVYGYLMFLAATYLSNGSELLLEILGPGIVGGLFLPMLGALPDAMLILVSGLSGSKETAQSQVSVGMGLLAGSTIMLLTVIWGSCVVIGKCDIGNSRAIDKQDTKGYNLTGSGVTTDLWTSYAARIMVISVVPFIVVQMPQMLHSTSGKHLAVLIALIVSTLLLIAYCLYQVFQPWIQKRRLAYVEQKHVIFGFLRRIKHHALEKFMTEDGELDKDTLEKLFHTLDANGDGQLCASELKALIIGIKFDELELDQDDAVNKIMAEFDTSSDFLLDKNEFMEGVSRWLRKAVSSGGASAGRRNGSMNFLDNVHQRTKQEHEQLRMGDENDEAGESVANPKWTSLKAVLLLVLGTIIAGVFADPLVDAVDNFSDSTSIPTFFISFIALPLATNSSEAVSSIIFASRKRQRTASLTFSELYGAVTMNNVLCLSVFLALVYVRGLTWDFSAEVLVILIACVLMGLFASFRTTFPLWTSLLAFLLYPFSLALVYVLDYILGWS